MQRMMKWTIAREVGLSDPIRARLKAANAIDISSWKIGANFPTRVTRSTRHSTIHVNDRINAMEDHFILRWEMQLLALTSSTTMSKQHQSQPELQGYEDSISAAKRHAPLRLNGHTGCKSCFRRGCLRLLGI